MVKIRRRVMVWGCVVAGLFTGCGEAGGVTESCDFRPDQALCEEYQHSNGIVKQACGQGSGKYLAGPCDMAGTVGACRHDPTGPDLTVIFDRYYPPQTAAEVMTACQGHGTFVAP